MKTTTTTEIKEYAKRLRNSDYEALIKDEDKYWFNVLETSEELFNDMMNELKFSGYHYEDVIHKELKEIDWIYNRDIWEENYQIS
jgi:hypothetical protein